MPEAAIDENRDFPSAENNIRRAADFLERAGVDAKPEASSVENPANGQFRLCVPRTIALHRFPRRLRRGPRGLHTPNLAPGSKALLHPSGLLRDKFRFLGLLLVRLGVNGTN